ncbi:MAG: hypothetical protein DI551_00770 [Micavibrio aeruginosavorus]|uniref:Large polyvalent protein associated domain-containing protein n=1 Tax=Micavibrio aeruginosavorus TaxID=349221 RepID=A0A2W5N627_9BACT|nr:MAG: hypothetical protein DI551_00770 [Micavibrio aeruginosavorus]
MPNDLLAQNKRDAAQFDADHAEAFEGARNADALGFAAQFDDNPEPPAAAPEKKSFTLENVGEGLKKGGEAAVKSSMSAGRDIGLGIVHAPRSAARGAAKGINNMISFLDEVDDWVPMPTLFDPKTKKFDPDFRSENDIEEAIGEEIGSPQLPVPAPNKTETVTGSLIEAAAQFAIGMKGVDKIGKAAGVAKGGASMMGNITKGALADLLAFDAHEERLSNVIEQVPQLKNPVTEYLAADPEDGPAEAKFKQAVEGVTLGAIGDVIFEGAKLLKRGKAAKKAMDAEGSTIDDLFDLPEGEKAGVDLDAGKFEFLGRADSDDLLLRKEKKLNDAQAEVDAAFGPKKALNDGPGESIDDFEINFARIEGPDDIKRLMDEMVNRPALKPSIEAARRGKRDARETLTAATDIDGFDELLSRRTGDAFNAETIVAARKVYYDTTSKLMEAAKRASAPEASDIDQYNFRKILATHHAVQKEFMGVRAEAGRALQAWNIPLAGSGGENVRALEQVLNEFGGAEASKSLAKRLTDAGNNLNTSQINAITQKAAFARTADAVTEAWTLGLLTSPTTHVVNISSNVLTGFVLGTERIGMAASKDSPVTLREGAEFFVGMLEAQKDAIKNAAQAFRTGQTGIGISKLDLPRTRATARDILDPDGKAGIFSKALDGWGAILNKYAGGMLAAGDEYQKTVLYQAQVRALAVREGIAQGMDPQALKKHAADALASPSPSIRADALSFANYGTFTKELGSIGQSVQRATAKMPLLRFVAPFVRTPANIFKFTFERTPLAPLSEKIRADLNAGGLRRAAAMTKIGMGTTIMAIGADLSQNGTLTGAGPSDPETRAALRRTGWQPYSIKIGDTYYSYARFEPAATVLGMSADMAEILSNYEAYDLDAQEEADELVTAAAIAMGNQVVGKTFLSGFADMVEMLSDPGRYGEQFLQKFAGSFVPAGVAAIERAADPAMESVFNKMDAIKARIPGASADVPPRRNIWGEEIKYFYPNEKSLTGASAERLLSLFNPVYYSKEQDAPVDRWMLKNGFEIDMPQKRQAFEGVRIDMRKFPKAYDRLIELRGQALPLQRYGNQSMKDFFENLATEEDPYGRHIGFFMAIGNDHDDQQNFINQVVRDYTDAAKDQLLDEYPELADEIARERSISDRARAVRPPAIPRRDSEEK